MSTTMKAMTRNITTGIHKGAVTQVHDQSICFVSFSTKKMRNSIGEIPRPLFPVVSTDIVYEFKLSWWESNPQPP